MLIKPELATAREAIGFAWSLAQDPNRSGYPTYTDGIKTRADFEEDCEYGLTHKNREVLLYLENGEVSGWIQFLTEPESHYLETTIFNVTGDTQKALEEFMAYCRERYSGYRMCLGFPGENRAAIDCLTRLGWRCEERSYNDVLSFKKYCLIPETDSPTKVTRENFETFRRLHESVQGTMYWNADRLYEALEQWDIWMLEENGHARAAIYNRDSDILMHIYGVDYADGVYDEKAFSALLIRALNECKKNGKEFMVFFNEDETQAAVRKLGFRCVGEYRMFSNAGEVEQ